MAEHIGALALPVADFLAMEHNMEYVGHNRGHVEEVAGTLGHK